MRCRVLCCVAVVGLFTAGLTEAQSGASPGAPPEVTAAQALLQAGNVDSAIVTLEQFFRRTPAAVAGRLLLGNAYRQKGDLDRALAAYQSVTQPRAIAIQARFNAAGIHARRANPDEAIRLLHQVKASGTFDMDLVTTTADFASLQNDPRLKEVLYRPEDFERPFVEPVRIIHQWIGETKGDQFSWIARGIGDVDGDRVSDIVTSAPSFAAVGSSPGKGRIYLYSGKTGKTLWTFTGADGDGAGTGLEGAGDVNRDGTPDVVAGAPWSSKAYVLSGRDGSVLLTLTPQGQREGFGQSAAGVGDQNGDGHADVLVGAPSASQQGAGAGRAYLFSGKDGSILEVLNGEKAGDTFGSTVAGVKAGRGTPFVIGASGAGPAGRGRVYVHTGPGRPASFVLEADETGAAMGTMFVSMVGDVDGDRVLDVFASDFANTAKGPSTGRVYVHSGATGRRLLTLTGEHPGDGFGIGSADLGDIDGDRHDDLVVGAWQYSAVAGSGGKVYVYSGKDGTLLRAITGRVPGETLGFDATGIGDVDGDGTIDLLVTSSWSNIRGFRSGRMFVISGKVP
ncbi:MAG: FG-GAP repeat protein [Gemmatimonadales bacterium]|nr:FG-GAP repeat protein [Gemmatimonadales bacterium]